VSCELLHAIHFEQGPRARFLLPVAAVDAPLQPAKGAGAAGAAGALIERMLRQVAGAAISEDGKQSIRESLRWLRHESISRTGKALAARLLDRKQYQNRQPAKFFELMYGARSALVHRGDPGWTWLPSHQWPPSHSGSHATCCWLMSTSPQLHKSEWPSCIGRPFMLMA
jgi:hypothetical protein